MKFNHIVYQELWQKRHESWASLLAVLSGIAIMVGSQTIATSSSGRMMDQVHELGVNLLILPAGTRTSDYYTADFGQESLPEAYIHVLHTSQFADKVQDIVQAQAKTITLMRRMAWFFSTVFLLIGGAGIANALFANVHERRQEIGTLLALGATPRMILALFVR